MMESFEAVKVISQHRDDALIVATMTPGTELPVVSTKPELDLSFHWAAMGKASSVALGLALARPDRKVFVLDGDGALLMNLGSLVTIAHMAPPNFTHFLFDNRVYRCTGGQPLPRAGKLSFAALARETGYPNQKYSNSCSPSSFQDMANSSSCKGIHHSLSTSSVKAR
jgi:thiamine pyrophosphate-dependent acetolactate synthase large subunit-like protein